jgi:hypothetical protein
MQHSAGRVNTRCLRRSVRRYGVPRAAGAPRGYGDLGLHGPLGSDADLRGRWREAARAVMVLLSAHGLPPAMIAELLDCHPATVRRWISRFNDEGLAGLADRPRSGRPVLGGRRLTSRISVPGRKHATSAMLTLPPPMPRTVTTGRAPRGA